MTAHLPTKRKKLAYQSLYISTVFMLEPDWYAILGANTNTISTISSISNGPSNEIICKEDIIAVIDNRCVSVYMR